MASEDLDYLLTPCTAGDVKKSSYVMLKGHPCKIVEVANFKNGKHGHAKVTMTGINVLNNNKYQDVKPAHVQMHFAEVEKKVYQLLHADEETQTVQLLFEGKTQVEMQLDHQNGWQCVEDALYGDNSHSKDDDDLDADDDELDGDYQVTVITAPEMSGSKIKKAFAVVDCRPLRK